MLITPTVEICIQQLGRAEAVLGVVILSVCPSVTRVLSNYSKEPTGDFFYTR